MKSIFSPFLVMMISFLPSCHLEAREKAAKEKPKNEKNVVNHNLNLEHVGNLVAECEQNIKESDEMFSRMMQEYLDAVAEQQDLEKLND